MAAVFPSVFRANVQMTGTDGLAVNQSLALGTANLANLAVGEGAFSGKVAVGAPGVDGTNTLQVTGDLGVSSDGIFGDKVAVNGSAVDGTNDLHVIGTLGATVDATIGANLDVTTDGTFGSKVAVGAGAIDGSNILHVAGRAGIAGDLYLGGDLFMSGGLQLPQLQSEVITLPNTQNAGAGNAVALGGSNIPDSGMLLCMVASNNAANAPTATFIASKPYTATTAGVVSVIHSGPAIVVGAGNATGLDMVWNAGAVKPAIHYTVSTTSAVVDWKYGVATMIGAGPTPA